MISHIHTSKVAVKSMLSGVWLALLFDGSGKFFDLNHRTFFLPTLEFVRRLRENTKIWSGSITREIQRLSKVAVLQEGIERMDIIKKQLDITLWK